MKMLWNLGVNYAATTPLWYTLTEDQKYCHTGHRKEIHWLHLLEWKTLGIDKKSPNHAMKYDGRYRSFLKADKAHEKPNKPSHLQYPGFYHKFQLGTVQDYISYYQRVWEHVKHEYASVGDFSNTNAMMRESYMREIRDQILDAFDLKITIIFRDPVRRLYSQNHYYDFDSPDPLSWYGKIYRKWASVFGEERICPIVMEEFWDGQVDLLEDFLGINLDTIHPNCFAGDFKRHEYLADQWIDGDPKPLTPEHYQRLYKNMEDVYKDFEDTFGYIPKQWG